MKTSLAAAIVLFSSLLVTSGAKATLLYYEGFNYSPGSLSDQNGGTGFNSAWGTAGSGGTANVQNTSLSYSTLSTSGGKAYLQATGAGGATIVRNLNSTYSTGTLYVSFLANLDDGNRYFGLALDNSGNEMFLTGKATTYGTPGNWSLSNSSNIPGSPVSSGQAVQFDTTALMVLRIDFNASGAQERIRLYVNPTLGTEPATASADVITTNSISVNQIRLTAGYFVSGSPSSLGWIDEIRVGDSFDSVTPVPEPATWALFGIGACVFVLRARLRRNV